MLTPCSIYFNVFNRIFLSIFQVAFSDESSFEVRPTSIEGRVWSSPNAPRPTVQQARHPVKIMVWGIISFHGAGRLHLVEGSMNQVQYLRVLQTRVVRQMAEWFPEGDGVFQQDKAPAHTAKRCQEYLQQQRFRILQWPGNSPDLNCIENLWAIIKRKLAKEGGCRTANELIVKVIRIWNHDAALPDILHSLVDSMPRRIQSVITAKGGHTKY